MVAMNKDQILGSRATFKLLLDLVESEDQGKEAILGPSVEVNRRRASRLLQV
jgi:hypothetical protein